MTAGERPRWARAFAPATVANVAVGFDVLGHALCGAGDRATVRRDDSGAVRIAAVRGVVADLPVDPQQNTAGRALLSLLRHAPRGVGFLVELDKGVPLGSGMGGSSASAVAALVAANALLPAPLPLAVLYDCALDGEAAASGSRHGDNVAPALLGGLAIAPHAGEPVRVPVPASLWTAVVHPHFVLETRRARKALAGSYELPQFVAQSEALALVVTGCCTGDLTLIGRGLRDVLVEPRRAPLIPGFAAVKAAALAHGALGAAIAGAGPSVFAWCADEGTARAAAVAMQGAFAAAGQQSDILVSPVDAPGAVVEACGS